MPTKDELQAMLEAAEDLRAEMVEILEGGGDPIAKIVYLYALLTEQDELRTDDLPRTLDLLPNEVYQAGVQLVTEQVAVKRGGYLIFDTDMEDL